MQPIPKITIMATLVRRLICKFQINATGRNPIVKSVMAAPTLYKYATPMRVVVLMQEPWA